MKLKNSNKLYTLLISNISIITIIALLIIWTLLTETKLIPPLFLPSPTLIIKKFYFLVKNGYMNVSLLSHIAYSLNRIFLALFFTIITAVPLGILIGSNKIIRGIFEPIIDFYRPIPPLAYLPLIIIWFGIGEESKVLIIYLAIFAPVVIATSDAVRNIDEQRIRAAQSLGANRKQQILYVIFPSALPEIITGIRIGLGVGWSTLVAAELIAASKGIGFVIQTASGYLATDIVFVGILIIAIIAYIFEIILRQIQIKLIPWHNPKENK